MKTTTLLLAITSLASSHVFSATLFSGAYDLGGGGNDVTALVYTGDPIAGVTVGDLTKSGINSTSNSGNFRGSSWPTGATNDSDSFTGSVDLGKYIEFSLTASPGFTIDMTSIEFGVGRSASGPRQWEWRSSIDGFTSSLGSYDPLNPALSPSSGVLTSPDTGSGWTGNTLNLAGHTHLDTVTFRLYGFNAEAASGTGGLQGNLSFSGSVAAVPEPGAIACATLALPILLRRRRR